MCIWLKPANMYRAFFAEGKHKTVKHWENKKWEHTTRQMLKLKQVALKYLPL